MTASAQTAGAIFGTTETRNIVTVAGKTIFDGDGGPATAALLSNPFSGIFDSSGNFYIADRSNHRVRKVDTSGIITTFAGNGIVGFSGDGGPATAAQFNFPSALAFDSSGSLYISDLLNHRVRKVDSWGIITTVAGTGIAGFSGDGGLATAARLNGPRGVAFDSLGTLYIADQNNHRVRNVDASGFITTVAGNGIVGFSGDGGLATAAQLNFPGDIAFDSLGNLYIADRSNHRVRKVETSGIITTVAGNGVAGFSGDGGAATAAQLNNPIGVAVDSSDNLYISDTGNVRIRRLNVSAVVDVDPDTLNITKSRGKWVTAYIQFSDGRDASDVNLNSVVLQAIDPTNGAVRHSMSNQLLQVAPAPGSPIELVDTNHDGVPDKLVLKFDRATVASWAAGAPELVLRVEGQFYGSPTGIYFSGDTQIRNIYPPDPTNQSVTPAFDACDPDLC
jgi:hypothetical protein